MTRIFKLLLILLTVILIFTSSYLLINHLDNSNHNSNNSEQAIMQKLATGKIRSFCKRETIIPKETSKNRLTPEIYHIASEVAMYHADRYLNLQMVPTTIIKLKPATDPKQEVIVSCCATWITPCDIKISSSQQLRNLVSETEYAHMNIFYFLFGQYDRHFNNFIIAQADHKLYLIDNEAISRVQQYVSGYSPDKTISTAWVPWGGPKFSINIVNEPTSFADIIKLKQDQNWLLHEFDAYLDISTINDIKCNACRIWKQMLWRQLYICDDRVAAPFSAVIDPKLLAQIKTLDREILAQFWPKLPFIATPQEQAIYQKFIEIFTNKTLIRKQMILNYFGHHPEGIRPLSRTRKTSSTEKSV